MPRFSSDDRFWYSVLDVVQRIHGGVQGGTGDLLRDQELQALHDWLYWRIGSEGWTPTHSERCRSFDDAVLNLARLALEEASAEIRRRKSAEEM